MRKGLVWSLVLSILFAVVVFGATVAVGHTPLLGLDLKGGVSVVLQPQGTATTSDLDEAVTIIERRVNGLGVSNSDVARQGSDVVINLPGIKDSQQALTELGKTATLYFRPVDCEIPDYVAPVVAPTTTTVPKTKSSTATTTATSPSTATTVAPSTTTKAQSLGPPPAAMSLASASYPAAASTSSTTAATPATTVAKTPATTVPKTPTTPPTTIVSSNSTGGTPVPVNGPVSTADCSASNASQIPSTTPDGDVKTNSVILPLYDNSVRYVLGPADMTGSEVSDASAQIDTTTGEYSVLLTFTSKGATDFDNIVSKRYACYEEDESNPPYCSLEAAELDGQVESAPTIQASSFQGTAVISGGSTSPFTSSQANALAEELKYGSLPIRFVPQSVETVSATIGKDSLKAGLLAGVGGLIVVMIYMLLYYRALALVVLVGLSLGGAVLYSTITELSQHSGLTLTLAGVTGIIVSIGITVDSYVVYFERLKDEVRSGRTVRQSVERSFTRAFRTVLTADLVSFMAALILYWFAIGDVRGFAFMLGLSTLLDVLTAFFFIRPAVIFVGRRRAITDNRLFGIARGLGAQSALEGSLMAAKRPNAFRRLFRGETSFDFVGRWKRWFGLSGTIIIIGLASIGVRGVNFSIDFKGGTVWEVPSTASVSDVRNVMNSVGHGLGQSTIVILTNTETHQRTVKVEAAAKLTGNSTEVSEVTTALAKMAKVSPDDVSLDDIGPSWGSDITHKAVEAVIIFLVIVSLYIWLRFEGKMAIVALTALLHDILITAGIYSLSGFQVSPDTVIAFLTILGYSLYDTIVVFDRVQENTRGLASTNRLTYSDTVNLSMNQVLARSLNTSLVAIMPILSILVIGAWLLGATALNDFGLALFVGLTTGAYSSIFIASPLLAVLKEREPRYSEIRRRLAQGPASSRRITPAAAAGAFGGSIPLVDTAPARRQGDEPERPYGGTGADDASDGIPLRGSVPPRAGTRPPPRPRKKGRRK